MERDMIQNDKQQKNKNEADEIPLVIKPWVSLYRAIPKAVNIPFTNCSISFTIVTTMFFIGVFHAYHFFLTHTLGWPEGETFTEKSTVKLVSITHSLSLLIPLGALLLGQPCIPSGAMNVQPKWRQDAVSSLLEFCTGYMLYDAIGTIEDAEWVPGVGIKLSFANWCFLGHHFATAFYMTSVRMVGAGHQSAMLLMFLGEFTNPLQNFFNLSRKVIKEDCCTGPILQAIHPYTEFIYAVTYFFLRAFAGPIAGIYITHDLLFTKHGQSNINIGISVLWVLLMWGVLIGSFPWIQEAIEMVSDGLTVKYHKDYVGPEL